jgi:hypothetical protein
LNGVRGFRQREGDRIQACQRLDGQESPPDHEVERFVESLYEKHGVPQSFVQPLGPVIDVAECESAWGPDADRHAKLLIHLAVEGSTSNA